MLRVILIDTSKAPMYFVKDRGENCHVDELIDTLNKCKDAADALGFSFYKVFNHEGYPAGCYYVYRIHVGFNQITDPSLTKPKTFGHGAGLCERPLLHPA